MRGRNVCTLPAIVLSLWCLLAAPSFALAYTGPGPALEMVPFFYSLLVWATLALGSALLWPINALLLRLRNRAR
jgi:hypothetical protein